MLDLILRALHLGHGAQPPDHLEIQLKHPRCLPSFSCIIKKPNNLSIISTTLNPIPIQCPSLIQILLQQHCLNNLPEY